MAIISFKAALRRLAPYIRYHHILMFLIAISIIFLSILTAGCTTTGLKNVYLLSLSYNPASASSPSGSQLNPSLSTNFASIAGNTTFEVRAGYMGMCIRAAAENWTCSRDADALARTLNATQSATSPDPLNILWIAKTFRDTIVFDGLMFASIALMFISFALIHTIPGWLPTVNDSGSEVDVKPFPSRPVSQVTLLALSLASILVLVSALWQHVATATAASLGGGLAYGTVIGGVGTVAMVLGWGGLMLVVMVTLGLVVMILSMQVLLDMED